MIFFQILLESVTTITYFSDKIHDSYGSVDSLFSLFIQADSVVNLLAAMEVSEYGVV